MNARVWISASGDPLVPTRTVPVQGLLLFSTLAMVERDAVWFIGERNRRQHPASLPAMLDRQAPRKSRLQVTLSRRQAPLQPSSDVPGRHVATALN